MILHLFNGPISATVVRKQLGVGEKLKILDVGCGPGSWAKQVAKEFPNSQVFATDFVESFKDEDGVPVQFAQGNVLERLPYSDSTFDFVHMRFFTGALKKDEWAVAAAEVYRVVKQGGWVQLVEPDGELRSLIATSELLADWNERGMRGALTKRGGDPLAGNHLDDLLRQSGFTSVEKHIRSAPMYRREGNEELGELMQHDYVDLIKTLAPVLCVSWDITPDEMVQWGQRVVNECTRLEAFHNFVTATAQKP